MVDEGGVSPIAWSEVLETGLPELDDEHRALVGQCNSLIRLMESGGAWSAVVAAARELVADCAEHFQREEALMEQTNFPRRDRHVAHHRELERRFGDLVEFLAAVDGTVPEHRRKAQSMRDTLIDILFRHDLDYKSHLQHVAGR